MFVPWWAFVGVAGVLLARTWWRHQIHKEEMNLMRTCWARLPRHRRQEILYVRERIYLNGDRYMDDYSLLPDGELQQRFENSIKNALDGDAWALELLKEQVLRHAYDERIQHPAASAGLP